MIINFCYGIRLISCGITSIKIYGQSGDVESSVEVDKRAIVLVKDHPGDPKKSERSSNILIQEINSDKKWWSDRCSAIIQYRLSSCNYNFIILSPQFSISMFFLLLLRVKDFDDLMWIHDVGESVEYDFFMLVRYIWIYMLTLIELTRLTS